MITTHPDDLLTFVTKTPLSEITVEQAEQVLSLLDRLEDGEELPVSVARFGSNI